MNATEAMDHRRARQYARGTDHRLCQCGGDGCRMPDSYRCGSCLRLIPFCMGADDDLPDSCDECWAKAQGGGR